MSELTAERLRELLHYDPESGDFTWRVSRPGRGKGIGGIAGSKEHPRAGYVRLVIGIDNASYSAHRLAWLYVHGEWPSAEIDHVNGNALDNKLVNLRCVSHAVNMQNFREARSSSGLIGAYAKPHGRWSSKIRVGGKTLHLGYFATPEEAHAAYIAAKRKLHEGCTI